MDSIHQTDIRKKTNGVDNLNTNAANYGHLHETERHARMLADQARTPSLRENRSKIDFSNNRSVMDAHSLTSSHVQKFRVDRTPVKIRGLANHREGNILAAKPQALREESTAQRHQSIPNANQNMYKSNERSEPIHYHKDRNAPEYAKGSLDSQFLPNHVFNIAGILPLNKENPQVSQRIIEELTYIDHPLKPAIRVTSKTDHVVQNPHGDDTVHLKHTANYAERTKIGIKDKTQTKVRFDTETEINGDAYPLKSEIRTTNNNRVPRDAMNHRGMIEFKHESSPSPITYDTHIIPGVRTLSGKRQNEKTVKNSHVLYANPTVSGLKLDYNARLYEHPEMKSAPDHGKAVFNVLNDSSSQYTAITDYTSFRDQPETNASKFSVELNNHTLSTKNNRAIVLADSIRIPTSNTSKEKIDDEGSLTGEAYWQRSGVIADFTNASTHHAIYTGTERYN